MKVYFIVGELLGDCLGVFLMVGFKMFYDGEIEFCGVGGFLMVDEGLVS